MSYPVVDSCKSFRSILDETATWYRRFDILQMSSDQLSQAYSIAAYLRVASIAVALYDYLETQPTAWRFYRQQWVTRRISLSAVLFVLLRFVSIITLTLSNVGFFYYHFSPVVCRQYFLLAPAFKVMQTMISQVIIGVRAFNLSRRSKVVATFLIFIYVIACTLQWVTTMFQRSPRLGDRYGREIEGAIGNCGAFNERKLLGAWIHYAVAIIYDVVVTAISICYLLKFKLAMNNSMLSKVIKMMLYDGLGYLVMLTAVNVLNLVLYRTSRDIQNAGASLGYCVSWIMSQRLLIHLHNAQRERRLDSLNNIVTLSQSRNSAYNNSGVFPNGENKSSDFELSQPDFDIETGSPESMSSAPVVNRVIHMCKKHTRPRSAVTQ